MMNRKKFGLTLAAVMALGVLMCSILLSVFVLPSEAAYTNIKGARAYRISTAQSITNAATTTSTSDAMVGNVEAATLDIGITGLDSTKILYVVRKEWATSDSTKQIDSNWADCTVGPTITITGNGNTYRKTHMIPFTGGIEKIRFEYSTDDADGCTVDAVVVTQ